MHWYCFRVDWLNACSLFCFYVNLLLFNRYADGDILLSQRVFTYYCCAQENQSNGIHLVGCPRAKRTIRSVPSFPPPFSFLLQRKSRLRRWP